jgi:hypothetical protein
MYVFKYYRGKNIILYRTIGVQHKVYNYKYSNMIQQCRRSILVLFDFMCKPYNNRSTTQDLKKTPVPLGTNNSYVLTIDKIQQLSNKVTVDICTCIHTYCTTRDTQVRDSSGFERESGYPHPNFLWRESSVKNSFKRVLVPTRSIPARFIFSNQEYTSEAANKTFFLQKTCIKYGSFLFFQTSNISNNPIICIIFSSKNIA